MNRDLVFGTATLVGPQGLPKTYAIILAALSVVLIVRSLRTANREPVNHEPSNHEPANRRRGMARVAGMLLIGVAYIVVLPYLGYLLSVAMLITATTYFQGGRVNGRTVLVALSGAVFFWVLFIWLLRIQYPAGLWPSLI